MYISNEIIVLFFIISFLIYRMPIVLVNFSKTLKGKMLMLILTICFTLYNRIAGFLIALFIIFVSEYNYEINNSNIYEQFTNIEHGNNDDNNNNKKDRLTIENIFNKKN